MNSGGIITYALLAMVGTFIASISQVMLKKAAIQEHGSAIKEYVNPLVIGAYILFVGTTFISIYAYQGIPLSFGPIPEATSYIYVTLFGVKVFGETVNLKKLIALGFIVIGIVVYAVFG